MTQKRANLLLLTVSMAWGTSYLLMKMGLGDIGPFNLIALRFGLAFFVTFVLLFKRVKDVNMKIIVHSSIIGLILFCIFTSILLGLKATTASSAGFLVGTTVVFVPLMQVFINHKLPQIKTILGICVVLAGIGFLTLKNGFEMDFGSVLCLLGAVFNAIYIITTKHFVKSGNTLQLGVFQLGFASLFGILFSFIFEIPKLPDTRNGWIAVLGLAVICSAYGFVVQPIAQKYTTPESTSFSFALEPIFSAVFASLFLHEVLGIQEYFGGALILMSLFISSQGKANVSNRLHVKTR
ncbi:DMT family transporter [Clostridium tyrobutyricum]|uniref:DMT family transporter n=1 Tax=Clostridium tyrobutyricum TaxID=1519 RepID=UPI0030D4313C